MLFIKGNIINCILFSPIIVELVPIKATCHIHDERCQVIMLIVNFHCSKPFNHYRLNSKNQKLVVDYMSIYNLEISYNVLYTQNK